MKKIDIDHVTEAPVLEPAKKLLWDAAAYMEKHGKAGAENNGLGENGEACAHWALVLANKGRANGKKISAARLILTERIGGWITDWSDSSDQETVVSAMRAAALS